ncbi:MAG: hypothetical protein J4F31_02185 [Flavobacteriales bacterium]|nr:hypothetical protein [Flavobacteriales bacterium]
MVRLNGNPEGQAILDEVYERIDKEWRGIGSIIKRGLGIAPKYARYDAEERLSLTEEESTGSNGCIAGEVLRGNRKPLDCPFFGKGCTPLNPMGTPMVSSEGACAAYYNYHSEESHV